MEVVFNVGIGEHGDVLELQEQTVIVFIVSTLLVLPRKHKTCIEEHVSDLQPVHYRQKLLPIAVVHVNQESLLLHHLILKTAEANQQRDDEADKHFGREAGGEGVAKDELYEVGEAMGKGKKVDHGDVQVDESFALIQFFQVKVLKLLLGDVQQEIGLALVKAELYVLF